MFSSVYFRKKQNMPVGWIPPSWFDDAICTENSYNKKDVRTRMPKNHLPVAEGISEIL